MKRKFFVLILIITSIIICFGTFNKESEVFAEEYATILENNDYRLQADYLDFCSIPTSAFTYKNSGGELSGNELSKAFDRNYSSSFKSKQLNNVNYTDSNTGETKNNYINTIDITFESPATLNRIIYASENGTTRGFPIQLNLYYYNNNQFELIRNYNTTETTKFVIFDFGKNIEITKFRFEYVKVSTKHSYHATAKEIIFLQPENNLLEQYKNLFTDYTETTLNSNYNTFEKVCEFEEILKNNINYPSFKGKLTRAKEVALNKVVFDPKREFTTNQSATNVINQYGDIARYCQNDLQMSSFGTNRQVTGILSTEGSKITIYVDGNENDPLPKIRFSQHMGSWRKWMSGELQLKLGKNTFTTPNFKFSDYTVDVVLGGPIYLCNPYTSETQSENVKVYIEGGTLYPVLRKNTNENLYKTELSNYVSQLQTNASTMVDVTEIVTDHVIVTVNATKANELYEIYSPNDATKNWDIYMDKLLEFGGVTQNESNTLFDERNLHVNFNVRLVQPWAGAAAFAYTEHVGVYTSWQGALIVGSGFGWGMSHEIGHMLDNKNRIVGECSNNMYAKYNETAIEQANSRGDFSKTLDSLSNDLTFNNSSYFNSNRYNFLIWWYIESWHKGYWANLENCYRGIYPKLQQFLELDTNLSNKINSLTKTEKQVFYSSIATGVDLSYYFERWGYSLSNDLENDPIFKVSSASQNFHELMTTAANNGIVDNSKQYKLWYQTNLAYHNENTTPEYSATTSVSIKNVLKTNSGYNIFINQTPNENHLGYEILEGNDTNGYKVIGFTYSTSFTDTTEYNESYTPNYKVVAVDNTFSCSSESSAKSVENNSEIVCKINDIGYSSLFEAINNAKDGDTIKLIKSINSVNLQISKNLTIQLDESVTSNITISKIEDGHLITMLSNKTLSLLGNETYKIILNGNSFKNSGSLLSIAGIVNAKYVVFENNISTNSGGAICMQANSKYSLFENCIIQNNQTNNGSAYYCDYANSNAIFTNVQIMNNTSLNDGIIANKGTLTLNYVEIKNNNVQVGTIKNYAGGVMYINNCIISNNTAKIGAGLHIDGFTSIKNSEVKNNSATETAGGLYYATTVGARKLTIENSLFSENTAKAGKDLVINNGNATLTGTTFSKNSELCLFGGEILISNNSNLKSLINIKNGVKIKLSGGKFENYENCEFCLVTYEPNMLVLTGLNYNLTQQDCANINLLNENIKLSLADNSIYAVSQTITLQVNLGSNNITNNYNYGESVLLNFGNLETKYAYKFVDSENNEFKFNETIIITKNLTLSASFKDKIKINFNFENKSETKYYLPYSLIELPKEEKGDSKILGWKNNNAFYNVEESAIATSNTTYTAIYEQLLKLVLMDGEKVIFENYFEFGTILNLNELVEIKNLSHWTMNNEKVNSNFEITNNSILTAQHKNILIFISLIVVGGMIIVALFLLWNKKRKLLKKVK